MSNLILETDGLTGADLDRLAARLERLEATVLEARRQSRRLVARAHDVARRSDEALERELRELGVGAGDESAAADLRAVEAVRREVLKRLESGWDVCWHDRRVDRG